MAGHTSSPQWREFERLVARIEADAGPRGLTVKSPDRIRCKETGRHREVDASIRSRVGTSDLLITIECRNRAKVQDVTWIEQLAAKREALGASLTVAVSSSGFSADAEIVAARRGILLRRIDELTLSDLNPALGLDLVIFWHKAFAPTGVGVRKFNILEYDARPEPDEADYVFPADTDLHAEIFHDSADGTSWSLNSIWLKVQGELDPFSEIEKGAPPILRTARIEYPGTVTVKTPLGPMRLGYVFLGMAMWIEPEFVSIEDARKIQYTDKAEVSIQRVEFASARTEDWRISLQARSDATSVSDVRVGGNWPHFGKIEQEA